MNDQLMMPPSTDTMVWEVEVQQEIGCSPWAEWINIARLTTTTRHLYKKGFPDWTWPLRDRGRDRGRDRFRNLKLDKMAINNALLLAAATALVGGVAAQTAGDFSILSMNVAGLPEILQSNEVPGDKTTNSELIGTKFAALDYDLIHVQEV